MNIETDLIEGDYVRMYCNWCERDLYLRFLSYDNSEGSPGFVYFNPLVGETAKWFLSNVSEVKRSGNVIWSEAKNDH